MVLDVEGSELPVLKTIDWTRLSIDVFNIEYKNERSKLEKLRQFFNKTGLGYKDVGFLPLSNISGQDVIFMRAYGT